MTPDLSTVFEIVHTGLNGGVVTLLYMIFQNTRRLERDFSEFETVQRKYNAKVDRIEGKLETIA